MTLQKQFEQELSNHAGGAGRLTAEDAPRLAVCEVVEHNSLAVSFERLQLRTTELAGAAMSDLQRISEALAARLTYLMEPISPIEIDAQECVVQMRSNPPQCDDDGHAYFELLVRRGGEISLRRYRKENNTGRQPIAATVTREVLVRLVGDFCAVLG
jgi:hypothetical protein